MFINKQTWTNFLSNQARAVLWMTWFIYSPIRARKWKANLQITSSNWLEPHSLFVCMCVCLLQYIYIYKRKKKKKGRRLIVLYCLREYVMCSITCHTLFKSYHGIWVVFVMCVCVRTSFTLSCVYLFIFRSTLLYFPSI